MRYQIRQRLLTFTAHYDIANEAGEPILEAVRVSWLRPLIVIHSKNGVELALLRQKLLTWRPRFDITRDGKPLATVVRRMTLKPYFTVDLAEGGCLEVTGSSWAQNYRITEGRRVIAVVSCKTWSLRGVYGVEVMEAEYDAVVLATVIAIAALNAQSNQSS